MIMVFFFSTTVVSAVGWLACYTGLKAMVMYMKDKGYTPPSEDETKAYCGRALKEMFHVS